MSLDLNRLRKASHDNISVGGSYTDTMITAQGFGSNAKSSSAFVRWVPNNKSGSGYYSGNDVSVTTSNLNSNGYLEFDAYAWSRAQGKGDGYHLLKFNYFNDTNSYNNGSTSPGIRLQEHYFAACTAEGLTDGAAKLAAWYTSNTKCVIVIVNVGSIHVNSAWLNQFIAFRSWRMTKNVTTSSENWSYAAVITNVNNIGQLSEALQGKGNLQDNATAQLVIEHKESTVGHGGYGEDLSSGTGAGAFSYTGNSSSTQTIATRTINWDTAGKDRVNTGEKLRITFDGKVQQGATNYNGYLRVKLIESNGFTTELDSTSTDLYERIEGLHTRATNVGSGSATLEIKAYAGSGAGAGNPFNEVHGRNLEVYKAGNNPDQDRDVAVHKWHINGLNIAEGPANFDLKEPGQFSTFYSSSRNLADISQTYTLDTTNGPLKNYQSNNGGTGSGAGLFNKVAWHNNLFTSTSNTQQHMQVTEMRGVSGNQTKELNLGGGSITVDSTKAYMAGVWVRVREFTHSGSGTTPSRISLIGESNGSNNKGYNGTGYNANTKVYGPSVDNSTLDERPTEWRLMSFFFLPDWMTSTEVTAWYSSYFGKWAGEYEWGGGFEPAEQFVSTNGINTPLDARVLQMGSNTSAIKFHLRTELYSSYDIWQEMAYPFFTEIDPMNINDGGDLHFWDFTES
jgi:hypothetical protein